MRIPPRLVEPLDAKGRARWAPLFRLLMGTVTCMFLCSLWVVLRPLSVRFGPIWFWRKSKPRPLSQHHADPYAFLVLVIFILFAPVEKRVGAQVESLILNLIGMGIGIGWSVLALGAAVLASNTNPSTQAPARAVKAIFYAILAFSAGLAHAGSERVSRAAKLANFLGTWLLLNPIYLGTIESDRILPFLYVSLLAIGTATFCGLILFPHTANHALASALVDYLRETQGLLHSGIELYLLPTEKEDAAAYRRLQLTLNSRSEMLAAAYMESIYEVSLAHIGADELKPLMAVARRLKSVFAAGLACHAHSAALSGEKRAEVEEDKISLRMVGREVCAAFELTGVVISRCSRKKHRLHLSDIERQRALLHEARRRFGSALRTSMDVHLIYAKLGQSDLSAKRDLLRLAYFSTSLLQVSYDADRCLDVAVVLLQATQAGPRLFLPKFDGRLFSQREHISGVGELYAPGQGGDDMMEVADESALAKIEEVMGVNDAASSTTFRAHSHRQSWIPSLSYRHRYQLARAMEVMRNSSALKYAIKSVIGCTTLAIPSFLATDSAGAAWWIRWRGEWQVISFIFVLTFTTGDTNRISFFRILGTIIGACWALLIWVIAHSNAEGLVVLMTLSAVPLALISRGRYATVGTVFAVTVPPVAFAEYLGLTENGQSVPRIALDRGIDVIIGIVMAVALTHLISPTFAHREFQLTVAKALEDVSGFYMSLSRQNLRPDEVYTPVIRSEFEQHSADMQRRVTRLRSLLQVEALELSLMPKPLRLSNQIVDCLEKLTELFVALRFIRIHLPRRSSVLDVRALRIDLVAALHLNLFACASAFRSKRPLPQFLPSPRNALEKMVNAVHAHLDISSPDMRSTNLDLPAASKLTRAELIAPSPSVSDPALTFIFALAEGEVLAECVDAVETLVSIARNYYGTQAFLDMEEGLTSPLTEDWSPSAPLSARPSVSFVPLPASPTHPKLAVS